MFKRKLFKRALPVILSVAMVFESMPATAMAAESGQQTVETAVAVDTDEEPDSGTQSEPESSGDASGTAASETSEESDTQSESSESEEVASLETVAATETDSSVETKEQDTQSDATEAQGEDNVEIAAEDETGTESADSSLEAKITVNSGNEVIEGFTPVIDQENPGVSYRYTTTYGQGECSEFQNALKDYDYIEITVDGEFLGSLRENLKYQWQEYASTDESGNDIYTDIKAGFPVNAGKYCLKITLDAVDKLCDKAEVCIYVEIEKAKIQINLEDCLTIKRGTTVADFKKEIVDKYKLETITIEVIDGMKKEVPKPVGKDIVVKGSEAVRVYQVGTAAELADTDVLDAANDYIVKIGSESGEGENKEFKNELTLTAEAAKNYTVVPDESYHVEIGDLLETKIVYELKNPGKEIVKVYDGKAIVEKDEDMTALIEFEQAPQVYAVDDDGKETLLTVTTGEGENATTKPVEPKAGWYTRRQPLEGGNESEAAEDDGYIYTELASAPVDAGEYFVRYTYADTENVYGKSISKPVKVTIEPAPVVIQIDKDKLPAFYEGMNAADVRKALSELTYAVLAKSKPGEGENAAPVEPGDAVADASADDFFGVSYEGDDNTADKTQYYKPVFKLQRRVNAVMGEDGKFADIKPEDNTNAWQDVTGSVVVQNRSYKYEFRIIFTGNKAVYNKNGEIKSLYSVTDTSTNSANRNYFADISEETLEKYAVKLENVTQAAVARIDATAIVEAFREKYKDNNDYADEGDNTFFNPAVKIYDKAQLFGKRADYKQAAVMADVTAEDGTISSTDIKASDDELTYQWHYTELSAYETYIKDYNKMTAEEQKNASYEDWNLIYNSDNSADDTINGTQDACVYRLTITYTDRTDDGKTYTANPEYVYFKVEQQQIVIVPGAQLAQKEQALYINNSTYNGLNESDYTVYALPKNNWDTYNSAEDKSGYKIEWFTSYEPAFYVKRGEKDAAGKDTGKWVDNDHEKFTEGYAYGVAAKFDYNYDYSYYINYTTKDKANCTEAEPDKHHEEVTPIGWYEGQLYVDVDRNLIQSMTKKYDKVPFTGLPEGAIKLYSDEAKTNDVTEQMLNKTAEYDPAKVNVFWQKDEDKDEGNYYYYPTSSVIYGGTYTLALRFEGSKPSAETPADGTPLYQPFDGEWIQYSDDENSNDYSFTIKAKDITITPKMNEKAKAGGHADSLLLDALETTGLVKGDEQYFTYTENTTASIDMGYYYEDSYYGWTKDHSSEQLRVNNQGGYYAFAGDDGYRNAWYEIQIDDKEISGDAYNYYLRTGRKYTAKLMNGLVEPFASSYNVTWGTGAITISNRGETKVEGNEIFEDLYDGDNGYTNLGYNCTGSTYEITPREAVRFYYKDDYADGLTDKDDNKIALDRNLIAFRIYAPKEFEGTIDGTDFETGKKSFVYEKAVKAAGGYILNDWQPETWYDEEDDEEYSDDGSHYITVLFPLTETKKDPSFSITWEEGYTDTFKLVDAVLEADLTNAVAPKSIAFNGVTAKMAVGETQPLDVKITKAQLGDIIKIRYRIKGGETKNSSISIDPETGVVTALSAKSKQATIVEAYPVHRNESGELEEITGKGVKTASTKITVTEVSAPAIKSITNITDTTATVNYTPVSDGYRREIYLLDITDNSAAKKWKWTDVEAKVKAVRNGQFGDEFVYVNYRYNEYVNPKTKLAMQSWNSNNKALEPNRTYMVYVRNVSAARTLDDGSVVDLSATGAVKSFTTTKSQIDYLGVTFDLTDSKNKVKHPLNANGIEDTSKYAIALSDKSAQVTVYGYFWERIGNNKAEEEDHIRYRLAPKSELTKNDKNYLLPKLGYIILDSQVNRLSFDEKNKVTNTPSKYATISKSGKITLKGVDRDGTATVYIYAYDTSNLSKTPAKVALTITADAASLTGGKAKLKVGDTIKLSDYLDYKDAKKKKVPNYRSSYVMITDDVIADAAANGYRIWKINESNEEEIFYTNDWRITAVAPNNKPYKLNVTDILGGEKKEAAVTLTSAALDPVKGLKVTYVDDKNITINFTHAGNPDAFAIEVKDGRGSVVEKRLAWNNKGAYNTIGKNTDDKLVKEMQQWIQYEFGDGNEFKYYEKSKIYAYTISSNKLVRLSNYTITVTPVYDIQTAKPVSKKVKTTNIPASRRNVNVIYYNHVNNADIEVGGTKTSEGKGYSSLSSAPYWFTSGNTYTLRLSDDDTSRDRVTDTLTWKSSNTKVATVKANPGTYTATFKAVKAGDTTLTVTSKVTKKVIAKYELRVKTVGNGNGYGGDYENTWDDDFYRNILAKWDPYYTRRLEVLTLSNKVVLGNENKTTDKDYTWISFTAPSFGEYTFKLNNYEYSQNIEVYDGRTGSNISTQKPFMLEAGQKLYLRVQGTGTVSVTGTEFAKLTTETALSVKGNEWISFTAPEDNYYTFDGAYIDKVYRNNVPDESPSRSYSLAAGETIFIHVSGSGNLYVTYRKTDEKTTLNLSDKKTIETTFLNTDPFDGNNIIEKVVKFTAPVTAEYIFATKYSDGVNVAIRDAKDNILYDGGRAESVSDGQNAVKLAADSETSETTTTVTIEKGCSVFVCFTLNKSVFDENTETSDSTAEPKTYTASVTVTTSEIKALTDKVAKGTTGIRSYTVPDVNAEGKYTFSVTNGSIEKYVDSDFKELDIAGGFVVNDSSEIKAGDTIYLYVQANADNDAEVKVTKIEVTPIAAEKTSLIVKNGGEYWYSFIAKQAGDYIFNVYRKDDAKGAHEAKLQQYSESFGDSPQSIFMKHLYLGETVYLKVDFEDVEGDTAGTEVEIYIGLEDEPEQLVLNTPKNITLANAGVEALFKFISLDADTYTVTWTPAKDSGAATLNRTTLEADEAGEIFDITVTAEADKVKGTLTVTSAKAGRQTIVSGTAADFKLDVGKSAQYRFTVPADELIGYEILTTVKTGSNAPTVTAEGVYWEEGSWKIGEAPYAWSGFGKGDVIDFTVTAPVDKASEGTLLIQPIKAEPLTAKDVEITNAKDLWFSYTADAYGRYDLDIAPEAIVYNESFDEKYAHGDILQKGDTFYIQLHTDKAEKTKVTLKMPAKIAPAKLTTDEKGNNVTIAEGKWAYYEFTADKRAKYTFANTAADGKVAANLVQYYAENENGKASWMSLYSVTLDANETIFIRMYASQENTDFTCKVTQEAINVLTTDKPAEITLKAGVSVSYEFTVYEKGMYTFRTTDVPKDANITVSGSKIEGARRYTASAYNGGFYIVNDYAKSNVTETLIITNNGTAEATFKVTASVVEPIEVKSGEETTIGDIGQNEAVWVTFKVPAKDRYAFTTSDPKLKVVTKDKSEITEQVLSTVGKEYTYRLTNYEADTKGTKITIAPVKPQVVTNDSATFEIKADGGSAWFEYTTTASGEYTFGIKNGETVVDTQLYYYDDITDNYSLGKANGTWKKGKKLLLNAAALSKGNYTLTVTVKEYKELTAGKENPITVKKGDYEGVIFKAPKAGRYELTVDNANVVVAYNGPTINEEILLGKGQEVFWQIRNEDGAETENVKVTISSLSGYSTDVTFTNRNQKIPVTYTVPEDGDYKVTAVLFDNDGSDNGDFYAEYTGSIDQDGSSNKRINVFNNLGESVNPTYMIIEGLKAGYTIPLSIYPYGSINDSEYNHTVTILIDKVS